MKFQFSNVVVVEGSQIGVIVKSWDNNTHDVYVRSYNSVINFHENDLVHYIYSKTLLNRHADFYRGEGG